MVDIVEMISGLIIGIALAFAIGFIGISLGILPAILIIPLSQSVMLAVGSLLLGIVIYFLARK